MGKGTSKIEAITQQNELLKKQNNLLREQIDFLRQLVSSTNAYGIGSNQSPGNDREVFIENIDLDEMRSGFLVTSQRKKLWNVQINLINEFARICKKHNLRWFAHGGTMLGAVRHKGFVPWDDDVDILIFRPDYEKFKQIAAQEIKPPYLLRPWYDYRLESDTVSLSSEANLPLIDREKEMKYATCHPF